MFKTTKRALAVLLAVLMLVCYVPFASFAEGETEGPAASLTIGGEVTGYNSVQAAIDAIPAGGTGTVKVLKQAVGGVVLNADKTVILDLNKDAFEYVEGKITLRQGFLTLKNGWLKGYPQSVNVYASGDDSFATGAYNSLTVAEDASIGGNETGYAVILREAENKTAYGSKIDINGSITGYVWVMGNILAGNAVINVNEGATIFGVGIAIALNGYATLNVKGGEITGGTESEAGTGIEVRSGNLNVTGGKITGYGAVKFNPNGSGTTSTGCGIAVAQHTTKNNIKVEISGDADVKGTVALAIANPQLNQEGEISVSVKGGTFTSTAEENAVVVSLADNETRVNAFISGGTFSNVLPEAYFAKDAQVKQKVAKADATADADGNIEHYVGADGTCFTLSDGAFAEIPQADTIIHYWAYDNAEEAVWLDDHSSCSVTVPCAHCDATQTLRSKGVKYAVVSEPTCQSEGTGRYTATFENENIADETDDVKLPMAKHTFNEAGVGFIQEGDTWYAYGTCKNHPTQQVKVEMKEVEVSEQTCEKAQTVKYVAVINGETFETEVMKKGEPLGHDYQLKEFTWTGLDDPDAVPTATATFVCQNDTSHVETRTATVEQTGSTVLPTCVADGNKVYKATVNFEGAVFYGTETVTLPKTGHSYGAWTSNNNGTHSRVCEVCQDKQTESCSGGEATCSAKAICKDCNTAYGLLNLENHKNTSEKPAVKATCTTKGFTAGVYCNDCKLYISGHESVDIDTSKAGHTYDTPAETDWTWEWNKETKTYDAKVSLTCPNCEANTPNKQIEVNATVGEPISVDATHLENGSITYTATATVTEGVSFTGTKVDTITAEGHTVQTVTGVPATCTEGGNKAYTYCSVCKAILTIDGADVASQNLTVTDNMSEVTLEKLGHDWGEATYTWAEDNSTVTATRTCKREGCGATEIETANATGEITTTATCMTKGVQTFTSDAFENTAFSVQTTEVDLGLDKDNHRFTNYVSNGDATYNADGTKTATCDYGCGTTKTVPDEGTQLSCTNHIYTTKDIAPTCEKEGTRIFTCTLCGHVETQSIAKLDHNDKDNDGYCDNGCGQMMTGGNHCKYCGKIHDGLFGWLVGFFHSILAIFKR